MRWFISDTHFGHANVIDYSERPFLNVKDMDNTMIARWNARVAKDDDVFVLGDFGLAGTKYLTDVFHALNGNKILIRGNHDGTVSKMRRIGFETVLEEAVVLIGGVRVQLIHYPYESFMAADEVVLHGHIHERGKPFFVNGQMCMCVELWDYAPVSEKVVEKLIQKWVRDGTSSNGGTVGRSGGADEGGDEL